ncbi:NAD(P)-binding protein [Mycena sanguinolenta]|uniref:NAD(P)-binding protein n=1 Tax=Mycena sanguinolenta TaxID=230812 RepID=A0A8H6ZIC6_9AGAR|nr:NAD(P)-binding protein [Mycena sanguinolenta]
MAHVLAARLVGTGPIVHSEPDKRGTDDSNVNPTIAYFSFSCSALSIRRLRKPVPSHSRLHRWLLLKHRMASKGTALVTGSARGIGRAIALRLADDGFDVAVNDIPVQSEALAQLVAEISAKGRKSSLHIADVSLEDEVRGMVEAVANHYGSLDVMVANAGIAKWTSVFDMTAEQWDLTMNVNARSAFLCYKYAGMQMIKQGKGGRIIGASSVAGKRGSVFNFAYTASKFAVRGLTQAAALEFGPHGITVNAYAPGAVDTDMLPHVLPPGTPRDTLLEEMKKLSPQKAVGTPTDIANVVSFIASKESSFITGQASGSAFRISHTSLPVSTTLLEVCIPGFMYLVYQTALPASRRDSPIQPSVPREAFCGSKLRYHPSTMEHVPAARRGTDDSNVNPTIACFSCSALSIRRLRKPLPSHSRLHRWSLLKHRMASKGTALVTGSARGIGRAIALRLADDGFDVAVNDIPVQSEALAQLVAEISAKGRKSSLHIADVSLEDEVRGMVEAVVNHHGSLDVMVANAGIAKWTSVFDMTTEQWDLTMNVNARSAFLCYKYAGMQMIKQGKGGRIIGASSVLGKQGSPFNFAYTASKFAVRGLTQAAALEFGPHGITVNAYAPGAIDTDMLPHVLPPGTPRDTLLEEMKKLSPQKAVGTPTDIANVVSFIASKESSFITGQTMSVNGGTYFD